MKQRIMQLKPQDIVLLLKIISINDTSWNQKPVARSLGMSQSEVSDSVARSRYAGLMDITGKIVMKSALLELLSHGVPYVFPQKPGAVVRGLPTAHSASPLKEQIQSTEIYVWPYAQGNVRGHSILPLYPSVPKAVLNDPVLYELLVLTDALRVGRAREKELALTILKKQFNIGE
ncbi:MAG: hypothetical protein J0I84_10255 [Terrimonas sp.]|nr:hypothetical protein [Terrimonas sp.]OJY81350.1 MAG: hypothetical protein BGP13_15225 [Sphingobacteriales bacterium 40-81]